MKTETLIGILGMVLVGIFVALAVRNYAHGNTSPIDAGSIGMQAAAGNAVTLGFRNFNYYPEIIPLQYNVPARITVDTAAVQGCYRSIVIPDFGIRKYITEADNVISFTPDKRGTFRFSCAMGMGAGKIVVS